ncbi:MAG: redoxin domain-containing protein [Anaerolineales bacterium]|nr:redoxin domain-containing protein [Anaerolineales bacterium]
MPENRFIIVILWVIAALILAACNAEVPFEEALSEVESVVETTAVAPTMPHSTPTLESATQTPPATPTLAPTEIPPAKETVNLPDLGPAPEFTNQVWLNTDAPITLASVQGEKAVLVEFWTFGCINCKRTIPWVREWHEKYSGDEFVVVSVHYPEFNYERELENVRNATVELDVPYSVAIDNEGTTWRAYKQRYWPTTYLIDKNGRIRLQHIGEFRDSSAAEMEAAIQTLMAQ